MDSSRVLVVGCFDPFHYGHLMHLAEARMHGDELIVAVTRDPFVNKGPRRPVFDVWKRSAVIQALACVDKVIHCDGSLHALDVVRPNVFALGREYEGKVDPRDEMHCHAHNVRIVFTDGPVYSSTDLLHHYDLARQR